MKTTRFPLYIALLAGTIGLSACRSESEKILRQLSLEEKVHLCIGLSCEPLEEDATAVEAARKAIPGYAGASYPITRLGIRPIFFCDGPAGLRISPLRDGDSRTYYCTQFPIGTALASSWNPSLIENVGAAMGREVKEYGADVLLGPGMNIQRHPLNGRNFEYFSEDPLLSGKTAAAYVRGVQSEGVGACIKHFACNNQETSRLSNDAIVGERALREIYLKGFEIAVRESDPWTLMTSYNFINNVHASENPELLTSILRNEWDYKGLVVTDWGGGYNSLAQINAGNDHIQAGKQWRYDQILDGVRSGDISEKTLNRSASRLLDLAAKVPSGNDYQPSYTPDLEAHALLAREAAAEGAVLLHNPGKALPYSSDIRQIALFGISSYDLIGSGVGSGDVNCRHIVSLDEGLLKSGIGINLDIKAIYDDPLAAFKAHYASLANPSWPQIERPAEPLISVDAIRLAAMNSDGAIFTLGRRSGEWKDRPSETFYLSDVERQLLGNISREFHALGKKLTVILNVCGPIEVASWKNEVDAILLTWLGGEASGAAAADILTGRINPSGHLAQTFPIDLADVPAAGHFPVDEKGAVNIIEIEDGVERENVHYTIYDEGIYVGYRGYDAKNKRVTYPFGYGLSYTSFKMRQPIVTRHGDTFTIEVVVSNTGSVAGKEVVQVYVSAPCGVVADKPKKELKAFAKTDLLAPGCSQAVTMTLSREDLASFDETSHSWVLDEGVYDFLVGFSSRDIKYSVSFALKSKKYKTLTPLTIQEHTPKYVKYNVPQVF